MFEGPQDEVRALQGKGRPPEDYLHNEKNITKRLFTTEDITLPETATKYFESLYKYYKGALDEKGILKIQINSMMAQRNGITMDDVNLLIDALQHMFENDMSSGRALTLRKLIVVEHTKPIGNVPRDTIENALTATLKIPDDCPTSYNDYIVTFHRNLLPKEVKVTEYGIDGSSKVML